MTQTSERKRWITWELIEILTYIDNNIDSFYESAYAACAKAKEATQTTRSVGSVYYKVSTMLKAMDNYNKTGEKTCQDIWTDEKIYEIVKSICGKYRERMRKEREQEIEEAARKRRKKNVRFETDTRTNADGFFEE